MAILVKNQSKRLIDEIWQLKKDNKPLLSLLFDVRNYVSKNFNKDITLTMIYRTQEEQDDIYRGKSNSGGREYDKKPWKSPHQFAHALDLRSKTFTDEEIKELTEYINNKYNGDNYYKTTAIYHNVGLGDHYHIQYYKV